MSLYFQNEHISGKTIAPLKKTANNAAVRPTHITHQHFCFPITMGAIFCVVYSMLWEVQVDLIADMKIIAAIRKDLIFNCSGLCADVKMRQWCWWHTDGDYDGDDDGDDNDYDDGDDDGADDGDDDGDGGTGVLPTRPTGRQSCLSPVTSRLPSPCTQMIATLKYFETNIFCPKIF